VPDIMMTKSNPWKIRTKGVSFPLPDLCYTEFAFLAFMTEDSKKIFFELLLPILDKLQWYLFSMTKNVDEAKDIVGKAVVLAYDNFSSIRNKKAFEFYLFEVARHEFFSTKMREKIFVRLRKEHENVVFENPNEKESDHDIDLLIKSLHALPERYKETLTLFEFGGFSIQEIRKLQGGTVSGVKTRLRRARQKIAALLGAADHQTAYVKMEYYHGR
jgi:RNA polymerase sigma-70 factor, ECF subfamily